MSSEVAQLKRQIELEYLAAQWGLSGLASGTAKHAHITARMERVGHSFEQLTQLVGSPEQATQIITEVTKDLPEQAIRSYLPDVLRHELGSTEEIEMLLDYIADAQETCDLLSERFGREIAVKILTMPSYLSPIAPSERASTHRRTRESNTDA